MDDRTRHVRWHDDPTLTNPLMVVAFTGWNDAGDAASTALKTLIETSRAKPLAEIDPEPFTDFATVRPHIRLIEENRTIVWPTVGVWSASLPGTDAILVLGPEPALRWRTFTDQIVGIAERFGCPMAISLGALLADVPHTRAVQVIGTASDEDLIDRFDLERSRYEGPTGIVGVLQDAFTTAGLPSASLWAAVPGYAAQVASPKAAVALIERACEMMGTPAPIADLLAESDDYDARVEALVADDDELVVHIEQLESIVDDMEDERDVSGPIDLSESDDLLDELEQFLREHDGDA
jgi:proteasome assembly chaperone (PAC2) family protein